MARRQGGFTELLDFASKLPWKVDCALAAASSLALHFTAAAFLDVPKVTKQADFGAAVIHQDIHTFAYLLQIVIPEGFLIGATVSFLGGARRRALFAEAAGAPRETISGLEWQDFEKLVGEHFRRNGYNVVERGGPKPDGGVDLIVTTTRQRYLVQCKHWRSRQVGVGLFGS